MGEGKTNVFGKTYNTIGSTDSNFIIKTKGDLKVQWGGKFIDVIKNGKLASAGADILKVAFSSDDISSNGVYLVPTDEGNEVWVSIDGTKVNIAGEVGTTYVSFLTEQKEVTADQKYTALVNAGLYYETLEDAQEAGVKAGLIFIIGENKLYVAKDGQLSEYIAAASSDEEKNTYFDEITVKDLKIYKDDSNMIVSSPGILFRIDEQDVLQLGTQLKSYLDINMLPGTYIQSNNATSSSGYRLYMKDGKSILEVDSIIWREMDVAIDQTQKLEEAIIYSINGNIIQLVESVDDEDDQVLCRLKYKNTFTAGGKVYVLVPLNTQTEQIDGEEDSQEVSNKRQLIECNINSVESQFIMISVDSAIKEEFVANVPGSFICQSNVPLIKIQQNNIDVLDRSRTVIPEEEAEEKPDDTIHTRIGVINEQEFEGLKKCPEKQEEVQVGIYSDNFIGLNSKLYDSVFKKRCDYPKYDESVEIPEDFQDEKYNKAVPNVEWIKELIKLAVPSGTIAMYNGRSEIPEGWAICDGNNGTPNLVGKFIKAVSAIDQIGDNESELNENNEFIITQEHLPKHSHPHKPHTHNLGDLSGITGSSGDLTVSLDYSDYNWGIESVQKTFVTSVTGEGVTSETGTVDGVSNIRTQGGNATGGSHTHSISLDAEGGVSLSSATSEEETLEDSEWPNKPLKIEPRSYSLVFIMKL